MIKWETPGLYKTLYKHTFKGRFYKQQLSNASLIFSILIENTWARNDEVFKKCFCSSELDIFGIVLFSVLTFMATVSMLIFIEECIYIYKKVPPNKKTVIIWVTGAAPVSIVTFLSIRFCLFSCLSECINHSFVLFICLSYYGTWRFHPVSYVLLIIHQF